MRQPASYLVLIASATCVACYPPIEQSHIDANVPEDSEFNRLLERDLTTQFVSRLSAKGPVRVQSTLLREGPTQTGIAYPKFYLWVTVHDDGRVLFEGAVRVAAIE